MLILVVDVFLFMKDFYQIECELRTKNGSTETICRSAGDEKKIDLSFLVARTNVFDLEHLQVMRTQEVQRI